MHQAGDGDPWERVDRAALLAALERTRLRRTPGTGRIAYSNVGAGVLGHALVAASGSRDFAELVRARICEPLGLADTVLLPDAGQPSGRRTATADAAGPRATGRSPGSRRRSAAVDGRGPAGLPAAQLRPEDTPLAAAIALTHADRRPGRRLGIGLGWLRVPGPPATSCSGTTGAPAASAPSPASRPPPASAPSSSPTTAAAWTGPASTCSPRSSGSRRPARPDRAGLSAGLSAGPCGDPASSHDDRPPRLRHHPDATTRRGPPPTGPALADRPGLTAPPGPGEPAV